MNGTFSECDNTLLHVLKECKTLPVFIDQIFGFLRRRTDFYMVRENGHNVVGLPPGYAETTVKNAFYKWQKCECTTADKPQPLVPPPSRRMQHEYVGHADCYNGASTDSYSWSQTISDLNVTVRLPEGVSARQLDVQILPLRVSVSLRNAVGGSGDGVLVTGVLPYKVRHAEALWHLDQKCHKLEMHIDKVQERWWDRLLVSEAPLDLQQIDCSRPFDELSAEAQAKIEELQWNQERKRAGLPTSHELQVHKTLARAWTAKGSPFCGPYDPAAVIVEGKN